MILSLVNSVFVYVYVLNMDHKTKHIRSSNMTVCEKELLADLVLKYSDVLENKRTDAVTSVTKTNCWKQLSAEFNACSESTIFRDTSQLKHVRVYIVCVQFAKIILLGKTMKTVVVL